MIRFVAFALCCLWVVPAFADDVRLVQQLLSDKGYPVGKVDGKFGNQTKGAIQRYQTDWQIPVTGQVTNELVARLERKHPDTKERMQKVENADCQVWNSYPQARESIRLENCISSGPFNGTGKVVWRWLEKGDWQSAMYEGGLVSGKLHGYGALNYPDGHVYQGQFQNGIRHGQGVQEWVRGNRYEGEWQDGLPHGQGTYFRDEEVYAGTWQKGCFSSEKKKIWIETTKKACGFK